MNKLIRSILRFIICHKRLDAFFSKYDWFNKLVYEEAQALIGNRPCGINYKDIFTKNESSRNY